MNMVFRPSERRLLQGLRAGVRALQARLTDQEGRESTGTMEIVLDELIKRQNGSFYADSYARGRRLADDGVALLEAQGRADVLRTVGERLSLTVHRLEEVWHSRIVDEHFQALAACLDAVIEALTDERQAQVKAYLNSVTSWEADLRVWTEQDPPRQIPPAGLRATSEQLQAYLRKAFPSWEDLSVIGLRKLPGGYSKATVLFETEDECNGRQTLVLRAEEPITPFVMDGADITNEYLTLKMGHGAGLPVVEPLWLEADAAALGARFMITRAAEGVNYGDLLSGTAPMTDALVKDLMNVLAHIHGTPLSSADSLVQKSHLGKWLHYPTLTAVTRAYVEYWHDIAHRCDIGASPAVTRGFNWLLNNVPDCDERPRLVHGDYGLHNILIENAKVSAVLDWEASHVGDPADDFSIYIQTMGRYLPADRLMKMYREAGGSEISEYRLRYYTVLACLKGPIVGYSGLSLLDQHAAADIKMARVGYRYVHPLLNNLNVAIERAEAARDSLKIP